MLNIEKHRVFLLQILKDIYSDIEIASCLGFKGGTAVYLFYKLTRLSVGLDFNLIDEKKKQLVFEKTGRIISAYGETREASQKRRTLFFLLSYEKPGHNLKVEISTRRFDDHYETRDYLGIPMLVMKKEDMFAHKLAALLDRKTMANRDLYDILFFLKNRWEVNETLLEQRTGMPGKDYLGRCIERVKEVNNTYILQGLGDVLDNASKDSMRDTLKRDLLIQLRIFREALSRFCQK
ncbi:MAG: nucleotidyl transferase AbiEii/AbiGii toxin family protein [Candidatus Omnitrophica bacterium]|nr:nucleotidyl transferase AbiEii/AbiGii toxin family protein [Candidatus Omnitrophota bacterium]